MDNDEQANKATSQLRASEAPVASDGGKSAPALPWVPCWLQSENRRDFEAIATRGRSALAWEVLRRDPGYRAGYAMMPKQDAATNRAFVACWGLHFP